jgi:hypothetical protein
MRTPVHFNAIAVALGIVAIGCSGAHAADNGSKKLSKDEAQKLAADAYMFGYPLVLMDFSRQVMTATAKPTRFKAPANQFNVSEEFPEPSFTEVVSPNADTLYSIAWLDLSKEPLVLSLPDTKGRYYLMQMLDGWTNVFASPGTRTTGDKKGDFAIVGPNWKEKLPAGLKEIKAPTNMVWILGRTQTNGKADYEAVRALKKQYQLTPLSDWGKNYRPLANVPIDPNVDGKTAPVVQVDKLNAASFFSRLAALMKDNPPAAADKPMVDRLARLGIVSGQPFNPKSLSPDVWAAVEKGFSDGRTALAAEGKKPKLVPPVNGWTIDLNVGRYGTDYPRRAVIALVGLGANLPEDAVYPMTTVDADGKQLNGANKYVLHFSKDNIPPVNAFWSLTMYNDKHFFVANPINRYAIGDRDKLKFNDDKSLTLYLQHDSPGKDKEANWLPAPKDDFNLILRLYWPKKEVLDGTWKPLAVERVK